MVKVYSTANNSDYNQVQYTYSEQNGYAETIDMVLTIWKPNIQDGQHLFCFQMAAIFDVQFSNGRAVPYSNGIQRQNHLAFKKFV